MKKILLSFVLVFMGFMLIACQGESSTIVDVFFYDFADTYIGSVRNEMDTLFKEIKEDYEAEDKEFKFNFNDGQNTQSIQTNQIDTAISRGTDLLIVNIVTTGSKEAAQGIVDKAKDKNIPIIFFNREVSDEVVKSYDKCLFVGTDADEAGYMQGQMIAEFLLEGSNLTKYDLDGDKEIKYIMFRGEEGNAEAFGRTLYSVTEANRLLADSEYTLKPSPANATNTSQPQDGISPYYLYGNWSATTAKNLMDTALTTFNLTSGDIELIIANNDDQAIGAINSMNDKGYNSGTDAEKYIPT
ncbi:MAG: substrate-binding domain-containing protein, partial [Bacilli bacterium]|nr:substrate-binding domain-containing protein [Bacilli bacterium]